jgi:rubredoxin
MRCKICGYLFDENEKTETCKGCMKCNCRMVRCPNCGYETLPESQTDINFINFLKKKFRSESK